LKNISLFIVIFLFTPLTLWAGMKEAEEAFSSGEYEKAMSEFTKLADDGNADAMYNLAVMYRHGAGNKDGEPDEKTAFEWYKKAAESGHARSQFLLGLMYGSGTEFLKKNLAKSIEWLKKSADHHNADAEFSLGVAYEQGVGVKKNSQESLKYYKRSAEHGNVTGQFVIAVKYKNEGNIAEAFKWYESAAKAGHIGAMNDLAGMYVRGEGVKQDTKEGIKLYEETLKEGNWVAAFNLGAIYKNGIGIKANKKEAYKWYAIALKKGYKAVEGEMLPLEKEMKKGDINAALKEADNWLLKNFKY